MFDNGMLRDYFTADQVGLDDGLERWRVAPGVPGPLRVDNRDRAALADTQTVRLGAKDPAPLRQPQVLEPAFQELPGGQAPLLVAALRVRLIAAEKDVTAGVRHADRRGNLPQGVRQNNVTSTTSPFSTRLLLAGISMYPSAWDMLVMSPEALKAGTAVPAAILTV